MARSVPEGRFAHLVDVATRTFVARGYRLTQMADVADALGLAKGTLYGYVESKEALFDAAVRFADGHGALPTALPIPTPAPGSSIEYVRARLLADAAELERASSRRSPPLDRATDELSSILGGLYQRMRTNRRALKLVDRCAVDYPELAAVWFEAGRRAHLTLIEDYLRRRIAAGRLRAVPDVAITARIVLETVAAWTIHVPWDPAPQPFFEPDLERAVLDHLVHALTKE